MLKLAIFTCWLAVCYAQPPTPTRPVISETFTSTYTVFERDPPRHEERRGSGKWDRSEAVMSFVETSLFKDQQSGKEDFSEHLGLFATHKIYRINTTDEGKKCEAETIPETAKFPMVWDWLEHASYHKFEDHRTNNTYDAWSVHDDRGSRTLLILESEPNKPAGMMYKGKAFEEDRRFMSFSPMAPPASTFTVPPECMTPPPKHL